mmetsp:Transcript_45/g.144  ORF Transcript_45/g.144 Transcript_45/m.144 type:complete len:83 (+) Transcript_45:104-352(+)
MHTVRMMERKKPQRKAQERFARATYMSLLTPPSCSAAFLLVVGGWCAAFFITITVKKREEEAFEFQRRGCSLLSPPYLAAVS